MKSKTGKQWIISIIWPARKKSQSVLYSFFTAIFTLCCEIFLFGIITCLCLPSLYRAQASKESTYCQSKTIKWHIIWKRGHVDKKRESVSQITWRATVCSMYKHSLGEKNKRTNQNTVWWWPLVKNNFHDSFRIHLLCIITWII